MGTLRCKFHSCLGLLYSLVTLHVNSKIHRKIINVGGCWSAREILESHSAVSIISHRGKKEHKAVELILALLRNCVVMTLIARSVHRFPGLCGRFCVKVRYLIRNYVLWLGCYVGLHDSRCLRPNWTEELWYSSVAWWVHFSSRELKDSLMLDF